MLEGNVFWQALADTQRAFSVGTDHVRRYSRGLPPLLAFADPARPRLEEFEPFCEPGERFYTSDWRGDAPAAGWRI